ncbi:MAG: hypothetical protein WBX17_04020 [Microbacterium sp.]
MASLRAELLGLPESLPRFRLLLPEGWTATEITEEAGENLEKQARQVFMRAGRPDLDGAFSSLLERAMRELGRAGGKYAILPGAGRDGIAPPLSLIVSLISGENGAPLDEWVASRFRRGAQMLDDSGQIVYWRERSSAGEAGVEQVQSTYVAPIPETARTKALMFTGTTLVETGAPDTSDSVVSGNAVFDAIVSTLSWVLVEAPAVQA